MSLSNSTPVTSRIIEQTTNDNIARESIVTLASIGIDNWGAIRRRAWTWDLSQQLRQVI
jgi:hypothetical protein